MNVLRVLTILSVALGLGSLARGAEPAGDRARPRVYVLELRDSIQPASLRYLERGLARAAEDGAELVLVELDTPGGLVVSLRAMTSAILSSEVPVAVYVTPSGARAASAGFFLLLAADVAAMAPGTNTGAAHPVAIGGGQQDGQDRSPALDKAVEDAAALARSLAAGRERPLDRAEQAVREATAYTADEARAHGLIDVIATDRGGLVSELDGTTVRRFDGTTRVLELTGAEIVAVERTLAERVLGVIADPQIAYLLLMVGVIGLFIELTSPGLIVPGVVGGLALLLGMYGLSVLPVNVVGALLIVAGLALIAVEVFATTYGVFAIAGVACFVIGSLVLVDSPIPDLQIGPELVVPVAVVLAGISALLVVRAVRTRHAHPWSGGEAMIGERGRVVDPITAEAAGRVFVHGEYWRATASQALPAGAEVCVEALAGLQLHVAPIPDQKGQP